MAYENKVEKRKNRQTYSHWHINTNIQQEELDLRSANKKHRLLNTPTTNEASINSARVNKSDRRLQNKSQNPY